MYTFVLTTRVGQQLNNPCNDSPGIDDHSSSEILNMCLVLARLEPAEDPQHSRRAVTASCNPTGDCRLRLLLLKTGWFQSFWLDYSVSLAAVGKWSEVGGLGAMEELGDKNSSISEQ
jgi:hypothetical protein